jgi:hypothetical protein
MRSETAKRILSETPQEVRDQVREEANYITGGKSGRFMHQTEVDAFAIGFAKWLLNHKPHSIPEADNAFDTLLEEFKETYKSSL